jgi:hypothetical protein
MVATGYRADQREDQREAQDGTKYPTSGKYQRAFSCGFASVDEADL